MSSTLMRVLAGAVAAIVTLLTALTVGLLSAQDSCALRTGAAPATTTAPVPSAEAGLGGAEPALSAQPVAPAQPPTPASAAEIVCTEGGFGGGAALISLVGVLVVASAVGVLAASGRRRRQVPPVLGVPTQQPPPPAAPHRADGQDAADRAALIQAAIYVRDRTTSKALADRLGAALRDAGVTPVEPAGVAFDPARHEAGGSTPSDDASLVGQIAAVEVPGYTDRGGVVLRAPVVTVYQQRGARP